MKKTILYMLLAALCPFFRAAGQVNHTTMPSGITVIGKVTDDQGIPLPGATVKVKNTVSAVVSANDGTFIIKAAPLNGLLVISFISYQQVEIPITASMREPLLIQLKSSIGSLDEVQIIGYGTSTKRFNTGSVSTISAKEIEDQPVTNVLSALSGRMPGVLVQTTNGLPGGNVNIQIRGKGSITAGTNPLYIIDGVPFATTVGTLSGGTSLLGTSSINGAISPFNSINPEDIESISILKDADATAIYGSRGSNGVVIITTKKGKAGKTKVDLKIDQGISRVADLPQLLDLQQYLQIRGEAFANDGKIPSSNPTSGNYAPELTVWDQTQSTDWPRVLLGNTGHVTDAQTSISGGNDNTNFVVGGNIHSESTILPGDNIYIRGGIHTNLIHTSPDKKFSIQVSNSLTLDNNKLANPTYNLLGDLLMSPNYPVYDASGNLNWYQINPYGEVLSTSKANTTNLITNGLVRYVIAKDLNVKLSAGYNTITLNQTQIFPSAALYPTLVNYTNFGKNTNQAFIAEPQLEYIHPFANSQINVLAGATYQNSIANGEQIVANNFSSEGLMENLSSAATYSLSNNYTQYKYVSLFARATYNLKERYILNVTFRRDGSSKFGPGNRFGNFGSVGVAWLFGSEYLIKNNLPFLSYGKFRGSYGSTGNDQIVPYQYLPTYSSSSYIYQGISGLKSSRIANSDFHWETTKKLELGIELGFFKDHILFNADYYENRSSDQLVNYTLPTLTGFSSYQANLPAVVQNTGWEFELSAKNIKRKDFNWSTTFNLTITKNKLLSFESLAASTYAKTLVIGEPITRIYGFQFMNVDPQTGIANYAVSAGGISQTPSSANDAYFTMGSGMPDFYGGLGNSFRYKNWQLDIFGQFTKQFSTGSLVYRPGNQILNNYSFTLNRWQNPGDISNVPKASTAFDSYYIRSSANYFDASYFRLKNVSLSYLLNGNWLKKAKLDRLKLYAQGQNLYTLWHQNLPFLDPESGVLNGSTNNIPPLRTLTAGFQITF